MGHYRICRITRNRQHAGCFTPTRRIRASLQFRRRRADEGESAAGRIDGLCGKAPAGRRLYSLAVATILTVCASESAAQTGVYLQTDMGATMAPQLAVDGSDNDWSTKCDLIINPLGLETGSECDTAPPCTSWSNEFDGTAGVSAGVALGYDWGLSDSKGNTSTGSRPITLSQTWVSSTT